MVGFKALTVVWVFLVCCHDILNDLVVVLNLFALREHLWCLFRMIVHAVLLICSM